MIVHQLIKDKKIQYDDVILKSVETRFPSRHAVTERVMYLKEVYKVLSKDELFLAWLYKQSKSIRQEVHTCDVSVYFLHTCDASVYLLLCFSILPSVTYFAVITPILNQK
jgi:hypothetical protein